VVSSLDPVATVIFFLSRSLARVSRRTDPVQVSILALATLVFFCLKPDALVFPAHGFCRHGSLSGSGSCARG
jgi:hypothetical protein